MSQLSGAYFECLIAGPQLPDAPVAEIFRKIMAEMLATMSCNGRAGSL